MIHIAKNDKTYLKHDAENVDFTAFLSIIKCSSCSYSHY